MTRNEWLIAPDENYLLFPIGWKVRERVAIYKLFFYINLYGTNGQEDG